MEISEYDIVTNDPHNMELSKLEKVYYELRKRVLDLEMKFVGPHDKRLLIARAFASINCTLPVAMPNQYFDWYNIKCINDYNKAIYCFREYRHQLSVFLQETDISNKPTGAGAHSDWVEWK